MMKLHRQTRSATMSDVGLIGCGARTGTADQRIIAPIGLPAA